MTDRRTLADFLMGNALDAEPSYTTVDVNALMPGPQAYNSVMGQARALGAQRWQANPYEMALAMAMGPKVRIPMRPTAGATQASPRQVAMEKGQQAFNAEGHAWLESGQRLSPMAREYSGAFAHRADMALRQAGGDIEQAMTLLKDDKQARNVLTYWQQSGNNFRGYADPARAQTYWRGVEEFKMGGAPSRLNAAGPAIAVPALASVLADRED